MVEVSWQAVCARRLDRHGLTAGLPSLAAAARAMCGVHAQIMSAAEVSLGLRVPQLTRSDVADALWSRRSLVKTFGPRGTVHLLAAEDLPRWTAALAAAPQTTSMPADIRLDAAQREAVLDAVAAVLADAELTVDELDDAVAARCGAWAAEQVMPAFGGFWPRWRQAVTDAARSGVLCFGPNRGRRVTYTHPQRWVGSAAEVPPEVAVAALVRDYLHAYGPATPEHLAQWLAVPVTWTRPLFADAEPVTVDGGRAWVNPGDTDFDADPAPGTLHLLPYFDAFVVGSHPRRSLFPGRAAQRALAGTQAGNFPVLLIDGTVRGVWHHRRSGRRVQVTVEPLRRLTTAQRSVLDDRVTRIGAVLEARVELTIGPVSVGPHA